MVTSWLNVASQHDVTMSCDVMWDGHHRIMLVKACNCVHPLWQKDWVLQEAGGVSMLGRFHSKVCLPIKCIVVKFQTPKSLTAILYEIWIFFLVWFLVKWCTNRCTPPNNKAWKQKPINTDFVPKFAQTAIPLKYVSISVTCFWNVSQKQKQGVAVWAKMGTTCIKEICLNFLFCFSISVATHFEVIKSYCQNWTHKF